MDMEQETTEQLRFVKTDPSGNTTILVLDAVPREAQSRLARLLMEEKNLAAEQVAFFEEHSPRPCDVGIRMMGGEFCGNAVRSAAAWKVFDRQRWQPTPLPGGRRSFAVSCTGIDRNVCCTVRPLGRAAFDVTAEMPLPLAVDTVEAGGRQLMRAVFSGIVHYAVLADRMPTAEDKRALVSAVLDVFPVEAGGAAGVLFWDGSVLDPFVYVKDTDTLVNESSCGSGTAALAACLAVRKNGPVRIDAQQAGGLIYGEAEAERGEVRSLRIGGMVRITAEGVAYV